MELILSLAKSGTSFKIFTTRSPNFGLAGKSEPQLVKSTPVKTTSLKPLPTKRLICSIMVPAATDLELPLP